MNRLAAVGCRTLWLDHGPHAVPNDVDGNAAIHREICGGNSGNSTQEISEKRFTKNSGESPEMRLPRPNRTNSSESVSGTPLDGELGNNGEERRVRDEEWSSMVLDVSEACGAGAVGSCEILVRSGAGGDV